MTKIILFWAGVLTVVSLGLGWSLRLEPGQIGAMAIRLPLACVLIFAASIWVNVSAKHKNSARGFPIVAICPALMTVIILGTAKFAPGYFDLSVILTLHFLIIATGNYVTTSTTWISGYPTLWNVKSPDLWNKSQRFFGYGTVVLGLISLAASLMAGKLNGPVLLSGFIALLILGNIHSFLLWKKSRAQMELR